MKKASGVSCLSRMAWIGDVRSLGRRRGDQADGNVFGNFDDGTNSSAVEWGRAAKAAIAMACWRVLAMVV